MFRFVTWVVVSLVGAICLNYYNAVERPDHEMSVALAQFENDNEAAKKMRQTTYIGNNVNVIANVAWIGFTGLCFIPPIGRAITEYSKSDDE